MDRIKLNVVGIIVLLLVLIGGAGWLIYSLQNKADPELIMGLLVVVAIAGLMTVLFILAAGFSSMSLADSKQPLGLPEGSIRAMISLVLIMVFIIFGIYLFRKVGTGDITWVGKMQTGPDTKLVGGKPLIYGQKDKEGYYDVWVITDVSEDGKKLAHQLITIVGTLVVSIASFYFGSTMASSAAKKEREEILAAQAVAAASNPVIKDITPKEGEKGQEIPMMEIVGTDFKAPRTVQLVRGSEAMVGTGVLSNATKIQCKVMIDKEPDGKWDVLVENEDGKQARLAEVFVIKHT